MSGHQLAEQPMTEPTDLESRVQPVSVAARARHPSGAPERVGRRLAPRRRGGERPGRTAPSVKGKPMAN